MTHKDLSELQALLGSAEKHVTALGDGSVEALEIKEALDGVLAIVAVHRIRAEMRNSNPPFEVSYPRTGNSIPG